MSAAMTVTKEKLRAMIAIDPGIKVRIMDTGGMNGHYWRERYNGYTQEQSRAGIFLAREALIQLDGVPDVELEIVQDLPAPNSSEQPGIVLTPRQVSQHADKLNSKMCRWVGKNSPLWAKSPFGKGYTNVRSEAQVFKVETLLRDYRDTMELIELLDQELAAEIAALPCRKCEIGEVISAEMIEGLKLAPANPVFRGLLLARLGKMPPADIKEFTALKDWIEFNCEPKESTIQWQPPTPAPAPPPPIPPDPTLEIELTFTDTESGRCRYSVQRQGSGTVPIVLSSIIEWMEDGAETLDDLMESIEHDVSDRAYDNQGGMDWDDDGPEYSDHEGEPDDGDWEYDDSSARRRQNLIQFLQQHLARERLEQLGIAPQPTTQERTV